VFQGYWKRPDATAAAFVEFEGKRFFRSGDLGRMDEEGYFFITDRLKRMINASGFKVWPAEVEALMFRHPAIQEACVISTKDAYRGEPSRRWWCCGPRTRTRPSRTSSTGAARTWRSTRSRARCSSSMRCPRAAAAR
jgi:acyl-CoA synthetase (AMP-forming)/AMP-acid ligase II